MDREQIALLAQKAAAGDEAAFNELYRQTRDRAYFVALTITKNEDDAFDILQEAYLKAWQKCGELRQPERFEAWLNQITANTARNFLKARKPLLFVEDADGEEDLLDWQPEQETGYIPDAAMDTAETRRLIMEIVDDLPEDLRLVTLLHYYDEMPLADICESLELPMSTVKARLRYARAKISKGVEDLEKRGTKLYGAAPIPLVIWFLQHAVTEGAALPAVILGGGSAAAAAAAAAGGAAASGGTAAGIGGAAAAIALPKIIAAVAAIAVIGSGAAVAATQLSGRRAEKATETTDIAITAGVGVIPSIELDDAMFPFTLAREEDTAEGYSDVATQSSIAASFTFGRSMAASTVASAAASTAILTTPATVPGTTMRTSTATSTVITNVAPTSSSASTANQTTAAKPGYTFATAPAATTTASAAKATTAATQSASVIVTYNYAANGGSYASKVSASLQKGTLADLSPYALKSGWEFLGWNSDRNAHTGMNSLAASGDVTLYAIYRKEVTATFIDYTFDGHFSYTPQQSKASAWRYNNESAAVTAPTLHSMSGWTPRGWATSTSLNASPQVSAGGTLSLTDDATYYGLYQQEATCTFNANGGSPTPANQKAVITFTSAPGEQFVNLPITLPIAPANPPDSIMSFAGWDDGNNEYAAGATITPRGSYSFTAVWR